MKTLQKRIKQFCRRHQMEAPLEHRVLDLASEVGEVAKDVLVMSHYGKKPLTDPKTLQGELGDVFYVLIMLANACEVDLEEALDEVLDKYERRLRHGGAGSR